MTVEAYALVATFMLCSLGLGLLAALLTARVGGPRMRWAWPLPTVAGFGAFYLIGHRLAISIGPEITLYGFQVALLGDLAVGFAAAVATALVQAATVRRLRSS
jgi:hypothetical protein